MPTRLASLPFRMLLVPLALLWVPFVLARSVDLEVVWLVPSLEAFAWYAIAALAAVALVAFLLNGYVALALAAVGLVLMLGPRIGRASADDQPVAQGRTIVVATSNQRFGTGDQRELMRLVRAEHVDVLALQENTIPSDRLLRRAGLQRALKHVRSDPDRARGAAGLALASRWQIRMRRPAPGDHRSLGGVILFPGGQRLAVRSVHPPPPFSTANLPCWKRCTRALRSTRRQAPFSIIAGDFNATLDHHPLRDLLASGYRDAADQTGDALRATWHRGWQRLTIDHILVSRGIAVRKVSVHRLPGSDHNVLIARIQLPR